MSKFREDFINDYNEEYLLKLETYILNFLKSNLGQGENAKNKGLSKENFEFLKSEIQKMTEFPESYIYSLICYVEKKHGYRSKFKKKSQFGVLDILLKIVIIILAFLITPLIFSSLFTAYNFVDVFNGSPPKSTLIYLILFLICSVYFGIQGGLFLFEKLKFTLVIFFISLSSYFIDYKFQEWQSENVFMSGYVEINKKGVVIPRKINVRENDSINSIVLFKLKKGDQVFVIGKMNASDWYFINFGKENKSGYVACKLIELEK